MGHSLCSFILRQIPRRSPTHNAVYFTTTRLGGYKSQPFQTDLQRGGTVQAPGQERWYAALEQPARSGTTHPRYRMT